MDERTEYNERKKNLRRSARIIANGYRKKLCALDDLNSPEAEKIRRDLNRFNKGVIDVEDFERSAPNAYLSTFEYLVERNERRLQTGVFEV
jgi:hypothetical protein